LPDVTLILLGAGSSSRFGTDVKKQWIYSGEKPLWLQVATHFETCHSFAKIIIVSSKEDVTLMRHFADYCYVQGGNTRQESLHHALEAVHTPYVLVSDIARACIPASMIARILDTKTQADCIVPALPAHDTLYLKDEPISREEVKIIQTPQLSVTHILKKALESDTLFTDDSSAITASGGSVHFVEGDIRAHKLTTIDDLVKLPCLQEPSSRTLVGYGIDIHPFEAGKPMVLCGVPIDSEYGFKAHSDGDVAIHAVIDALLGAAGMGDIGELYPDTDDAYAGADSKKLLQDTLSTLRSHGYEIGNIDLSILAQAPRITPYKLQMRQTIASILQLPMHRVNIKATTAEKLGFVGRKEGVTVHAVATLNYFNWKKLTEGQTS
jgi:2-C-methyl-D-erythritol 4-phosphate cytidylyltransferase/2-C-methyl-D-erythritol 2,4-cyclodiphosphate synthase